MKQSVELPPLMGELYEQLETLRLQAPKEFERYKPLYGELHLIAGRMTGLPAQEPYGSVEKDVRPHRRTARLRLITPGLPTIFEDVTTSEKSGDAPFNYVLGPWPPSQPVITCPHCGHVIA